MQYDYTRVDKSLFKASKMDMQGNADFQFWFDKTIEERLSAAAVMISVAFRDPAFMERKVDRTIFSARKHNP